MCRRTTPLVAAGRRNGYEIARTIDDRPLALELELKRFA
jgi:hypothetical protein